ncbi:hypothetical protein ABZP36_001462 [Zizania latifolia]
MEVSDLGRTGSLIAGSYSRTPVLFGFKVQRERGNFIWEPTHHRHHSTELRRYTCTILLLLRDEMAPPALRDCVVCDSALLAPESRFQAVSVILSQHFNQWTQIALSSRR